MGDPKPNKITVLADAMWQLLDDMGHEGHSVCGCAKAQARVAYEPFRDEPEEEIGIMRLSEAKRILRICDGASPTTPEPEG